MSEQGTPEEDIFLNMGLRAFMPFGGENPALCPKCGYSSLGVIWHRGLVVGENSHPCEEWVQEGLLKLPVEEHLCIRCHNCRYGWPSHTGDAT